MNNIEVFLVVEGQTEQTFIRDILAPEIAQKGMYLHAALIGKPGHKGGDIRFERAKNDIGNFLTQRKDTFVSMMIDYFRVDASWPGRDLINNKTREGMKLSAIDKAKLIKEETHKKIIAAFPDHNAETRFIPYIEMHEFEALLFSDASILAKRIGVDVSLIQNIINECGSPEEINDNPDSAPSVRLNNLMNNYRKVAMGKSIAEAIGINKIRSQCPNFNEWLIQLENI
ncbi:MAG: DUF4276 family protein [Gammaproteobacteria bacterium]|nr:DUF4276 family protein [Gammaproteobacteria bacterium]